MIILRTCLDVFLCFARLKAYPGVILIMVHGPGVWSTYFKLICSVVWFTWAASAASVNNASAPCRLSEFRCLTGRCITLNHYCDNVNDCEDSSDEPRFCTPCNRTYYGDVGKTYQLDLHRPREDKLPYVCYLTFNASGGNFGDIVQLTFDSFTVGRFVSFTQDGCPDGALQIAESNRPHVGGSWCGTSWGPAIYYSETKTVTIAVTLLRLNKDQSGYNFDFRMEYKMLRKDAATVRYGGINRGSFPANATDAPIIQEEPDYYLGDLITGTYCSRIFSDCDRKICRLQSPNFPGVYPRNLTCYYAVRQHDIPPGKHALITVRQPKGQLISIRSESAVYGESKPRELKVWGACDDVQDYVTVYDGYTTRDPVILKFCGGGEPVPEAVSSDHELLVEFSTSPYGTFLHPTPIQTLHGFQLEVEVKFVDKESPSYIKNKRHCEFWLRGTNKGVLESPQHSLTPNTTCLYHLQGIDMNVSPSPVPFRPLPPRYQDGSWRRSGGFPPARYRVWLSVLKFHVGPGLNPLPPDKPPCSSNLNVWDGQLKNPSNCNDLFCNKDKPKSIARTTLLASLTAPIPLKNTTLLARYCQNYIPRTCDHSLLDNETRSTRPCTISESFLSTGDMLTLELRLSESTALRPVAFKALYEFVDLHQDGDPYGMGPCSRRFTSTGSSQQQVKGQHQQESDQAQIKFQAPRNVFLYGRGGAHNISCVYRFEAQKDERVKLTMTHITVKNRKCRSMPSIDTNRLHCYGNTSATVRIYEVPWQDVPPVPRDCFCSGEPDILPFAYVSTSQITEIRFEVTAMDATDDFDSLYFEGMVKFIRMPTCTKNMRRMGASGEIVFRTQGKTTDQPTCDSYPLVITPSLHHYLYVKVSGVIIKPDTRANVTGQRPRDCYTANRVLLHTGTHTTIVCPSRYPDVYHQVVEAFSEGWVTPKVIGSTPDRLGFAPSTSVVVEFVAKEIGSHRVMWLELSRKRLILSAIGLVRPEDCPFRCPELNACINASVWCDGVSNCPSGYDEALTHCSFILQLPPVYLCLIALIFVGIIGSLIVYVYKRCRRRPRSILQTRLKSLSSSDTAIIDEKDVIC